MTLLDVQDLEVHFRAGGLALPGRSPRLVRAVNGVSFTLAPGEALGLVGESGCGKSTLGRAILRLGETTGGAIRFGGADVASGGRAGVARLRRETAMIFQDPYGALNPRMAVGEAIAEVLRVHRKVPRDARPGAGGGAADPGRPPARACGPPPGRAVRRPVPARRHRPRAGGRAEADHRR